MAVDGISRYALHVVHDWFNGSDCLHLLLQYNWSASLNWAFNSVNKSIDSNQTVIVTTPGYFNNLTNILSGASNS